MLIFNEMLHKNLTLVRFSSVSSFVFSCIFVLPYLLVNKDKEKLALQLTME